MRPDVTVLNESLKLHLAQIYETLAALSGQFNHNTLAFIRRASVALDEWFTDCDELHRAYLRRCCGSILTCRAGQVVEEDSLLRKILASELHYAKLWLVCVALRGVSWDKMPFEQRELAFQAKDSAFNCLSVFLNSTEYRYIPRPVIVFELMDIVEPPFATRCTISL